MLIFKQAVNRQKTALFLSKAAIKQLKGPLFCFSQVGTKWRELMLYKATIKRGKILSNRRELATLFHAKQGKYREIIEIHLYFKCFL